MTGKYFVAALLAAVLLSGCGRDDDRARQVAPASPVESEEQVFTQEAVEKINQVARPLLAEAEKTTARVAEKAEEAKQKTAELAATVQEKSVPVMEKTGSALIVAGEQVQQVARVMKAPRDLLLDSARGPVALPHREHAESFGCPACHGAQPPGPLALDEEKGHQLCRGCHLREGKGPVKCGACHAKGKTVAPTGR